MRYHNITKDDMLNGDGLRVVLWVSGCYHHCKNCHNPITWDASDGLIFDQNAIDEIFHELDKDYISGLTLSGGDPLYPANINAICQLILQVRSSYPDKTIWLYTGYTIGWILSAIRHNHADSAAYKMILNGIDVLVDGQYVDELKDPQYHWAGSTNQRVIDVQETLKRGMVVLHESN